jgi:hypothetical protein
MDWRVFYIIGKFLERRCLKWARMTHLDTSNTSYGQKKGCESNCQFDSQPLKVGNQPDFLTFKWHATYRWKALDESYNFTSDLILIRSLHAKYGSPKLQKSQLWEFRDSHLGVLGQNDIWVLIAKQNDIWVLVPWPGTKYIIKGKVVVSPKLGPWWILWVLWIRVCPWLVLTPKVFQLYTNQLVVWLCASLCEWVIVCPIP